MDTLETLLNKAVVGVTRKSRPEQYETTCQDIYKWDGRAHIIEEIEEYQRITGTKIDFVDDVKMYLRGRGKLTAAQYNALVKIYFRYEVDVFQAER